MMHISVYSDDVQDMQPEIQKIREYAKENGLIVLPIRCSDDANYSNDNKATWFCIDAHLLTPQEYKSWILQNPGNLDDIPF